MQSFSRHKMLVEINIRWIKHYRNVSWTTYKWLCWYFSPDNVKDQKTLNKHSINITGRMFSLECSSPEHSENDLCYVCLTLVKLNHLNILKQVTFFCEGKWDTKTFLINWFHSIHFQIFDTSMQMQIWMFGQSIASMRFTVLGIIELNLSVFFTNHIHADS